MIFETHNCEEMIKNVSGEYLFFTVLKPLKK